MGAALIPFAFEGSPVRVTDQGGDPWFVAADVCAVLGLSNPSMSVQALDDDERAKLNLGRQGEAAIISESGLWTLILRSREATTPGSVAHRLRKWVTSEVLPSIRRTGSYTSATAARGPKDVASAFRSYAGIARLIGLDRNQAALAANRATIATTGVDALALLGSTHLVAPQQERILTPTEIGQDLGGESARSVNLLLQRHGFQTGPDWTPTDTGRPFAVFQDTGKKHGNGTPVRQLKWSADIVPALQTAIAATAS